MHPETAGDRPIAPARPEDNARQPALWHFLLLYAIVALWIDFGHIHKRHNADTLLFTLASQYRLTPFFWEQDRVGQLVPAIASCCPDLLSALLVQTGVSTFLGLAAPLLLAELIYSGATSRAAATLANAVMLAFAPGRVRDDLLIECCYPIAITLGCAGLLVLTRGGDRPRAWRYGLAAAFLILAHWVYVGLPVWFMPIVVGLAVLRPGVPCHGLRDRAARLLRYFPGWSSLILILASFGIGQWLMHLTRQTNPELILPTPMNGIPIRDWPTAWLGFFDTMGTNRFPNMIRWPEVGGGLAAAGLLGALVVFAGRRTWPRYPLASACLVLAFAGATEMFFNSTRAWPAQNGRMPRYVIGFLESAQVLLAMLAVYPFSGWIGGRGRWRAFIALGLALFAAATITYGFPSPYNPRADLDEAAEYLGGESREPTPTFISDILDSDVDAVAGDYWTAWPAMFHANLRRPDRALPYFGIAWRCTVFRPFWEEHYPNGFRVALLDTENERAYLWSGLLRNNLSQPELVGRRGEVVIYFIRPLGR